jgi:hypothetical protein
MPTHYGVVRVHEMAEGMDQEERTKGIRPENVEVDEGSTNTDVGVQMRMEGVQTRVRVYKCRFGVYGPHEDAGNQLGGHIYDTV